jgi:hypothetical protein
MDTLEQGVAGERAQPARRRFLRAGPSAIAVTIRVEGVHQRNVRG